ncbi:MAG TPA: hypothetical protein VEB87_04245 [Nitrososphaerales archaeon]|nr:hypothetical protein [Nitrososphaerales archaeon]
MTNESFQLVQASVVNQSGIAEINATYRSNLATYETIIVNAVAYSVSTSNPFGPPGAVLCCTIVSSLPQKNGVAFTTALQAPEGTLFSTMLSVPRSLNASTYVIKLFISSSKGVLLSPNSFVFLELAPIISGGQAGTGPVFYNEDNGLVYVGDSGLDAVSVLNGATGKLVATVSLPDVIGPLQFYTYDHGNRELYIGSEFSPEVFALDTNSNFIVNRLVTTGANQSLASMVYDPFDGKIFGIDFVYSRIIVINDFSNRITTTIEGIQAPLAAVFDAKADELLVQTYNGTTFRIGGANDVIAGTVPTNATVFFYDNDNGLLYAQNQAQMIEALNATTFRQVGPTVTLPNSSSFQLYNPINKDLYFYTGLDAQTFNQAGGELFAVSTESDTVVTKIPVPGFNGGLVIEEPSFVLDQSTGDIYATEVTNPQNYAIGLLRISSSNTIVSQTFPTNMPLGYLSLDPKDGILFGAYGYASSSVFILNLQSGTVTFLIVGTTRTYGLPP